MMDILLSFFPSAIHHLQRQLPQAVLSPLRLRRLSLMHLLPSFDVHPDQCAATDYSGSIDICLATKVEQFPHRTTDREDLPRQRVLLARP